VAVPTSNIKLDDVRIELGLSYPTSLSACISAAGKTGTWTKLSDFAGYSAASLSIAPTSVFISSSQQTGYTTVSSSGTWSVDLVSIPYWISNVTMSGSDGQKMYYTADANGSNYKRVAYIKIMLQSDNSVYQLFEITQDVNSLEL